MKAVLASAALTLAFVGQAQSFSGPRGGYMLGTGDVAAGVICVVKEVTVLAATEEDCAKIGGEATHTVEQTTTPIDEE